MKGTALSRNAATVRWAQTRAPRGSRSRRTASAPRQQQGAEDEAAQGHLERGVRLRADLDEQEAETPDQRQHGEPDPPAGPADAGRGGEGRRGGGGGRSQLRYLRGGSPGGRGSGGHAATLRRFTFKNKRR
ncbi:hypothetical protein JCM18897A_04830 [Streptomyces sp. JCM 18897]